MDEPSVDERRQLIERVASSTQFRRSVRLRDFLLYVGGQSLKEGRAEIHEQEIGAKVFERGPSYDPSQDNIVRVNATELRKRIELYFATDGVHEPLMLTIPRGGYKPVFHWRVPDDLPLPTPQTVIPSAEMVPNASPVAERSMGSRTAYFALVGLAIVLAIVCAVLLKQNLALRSSSARWAGRPTVEAFWKDFVKGQQEVDIVLPDASVTMSAEITHQSMMLSDYLEHNYINQQEAASLSPDRVSDLTDIFSHSLVTIGDFHAAQQILALPPIAPSVRLVLARFYTADSIKRNSFVLIGGRKANPWMGLFEDQLNFRLAFDPYNGALVTNQHPQGGEMSSYAARTDVNDLTTGYCVVGYLPNPNRTGNVIVLAGTDSDTTNAAAEFLTSETSLAKFRNILKVKEFPHFEVLLKTSRVSSTSLNTEVIAYRVHPENN
ncbi:MAG: hypothetical protein ABI177_06900 [Edaphobacter sp.]